MSHNHKPGEEGETICEDCYNKAHPLRGKYTKEMLKGKSHIKVSFPKDSHPQEHVWAKIVSISDEGVKCTIANEPEWKTTPKFGTTVFVEFKEIDDVL